MTGKSWAAASCAGQEGGSQSSNVCWSGCRAAPAVCLSPGSRAAAAGLAVEAALAAADARAGELTAAAGEAEARADALAGELRAAQAAAEALRTVRVWRCGPGRCNVRGQVWTPRAVQQTQASFFRVFSSLAVHNLNPCCA